MVAFRLKPTFRRDGHRRQFKPGWLELCLRHAIHIREKIATKSTGEKISRLRNQVCIAVGTLLVVYTDLPGIDTLPMDGFEPGNAITFKTQVALIKKNNILMASIKKTICPICVLFCDSTLIFYDGL